MNYPREDQREMEAILEKNSGSEHLRFTVLRIIVNRTIVIVIFV